MIAQTNCVGFITYKQLKCDSVKTQTDIILNFLFTHMHVNRSELAGQVLGTDQTHLGVTHLFTAIHNNGYHLLYLTARTIAQVGCTV